MLHCIVRFGRVGAVALALLVGAAVALAGAPLLGWPAAAIAVAAAGLTYVLAKSYVELVTLIADMLIPK
jgi:hypothetical protein